MVSSYLIQLKDYSDFMSCARLLSSVRNDTTSYVLARIRIPAYELLGWTCSTQWLTEAIMVSKNNNLMSDHVNKWKRSTTYYGMPLSQFLWILYLRFTNFSMFQRLWARCEKDLTPVASYIYFVCNSHMPPQTSYALISAQCLLITWVVAQTWFMDQMIPFYK